MRLKKRNRKSSKDNFVRPTPVPFLSVEEEEEEEEEIPQVSLVPTKQVKKKKMVKRTERLQIAAEDSSLKVQPESPTPSSKKPKMNSGIGTELTKSPASKNKMLAIARRSPRVQNTPQTNSIGPVIENIEISEGEEDHPSSHENKKAPEASLVASTMEEKIVNLMLLMEEQGKTFKALLSEGAKGCSIAQTTCMPDAETHPEKSTYKNMYIDSQKKILELKDENSELRKKLEAAHAKLEGYEKGQLVLTETIDKFKDTCLLSTLAKTTEMVLGLSSSRVTFGGVADPNANRKVNNPATKRKTALKKKRAAARISSPTN